MEVRPDGGRGLRSYSELFDAFWRTSWSVVIALLLRLLLWGCAAGWFRQFARQCNARCNAAQSDSQSSSGNRPVSGSFAEHTKVTVANVTASDIDKGNGDGRQQEQFKVLGALLSNGSKKTAQQSFEHGGVVDSSHLEMGREGCEGKYRDSQDDDEDSKDDEEDSQDYDEEWARIWTNEDDNDNDDKYIDGIAMMTSTLMMMTKIPPQGTSCEEVSWGWGEAWPY